VKYPDDYSSVTYRLREGAKWHDGEPVTPEDVVFSFDVLKEYNPQQAYYYQHVEKAALRRQVQHAWKRRPRDIRIDQKDSVVHFHRDAHRHPAIESSRRYRRDT
jgi:hypothetical protein